MKTQRQSELGAIQDSINLLRSVEIHLQAIFFVAMKAPTVISKGILDRARAIVDKYLSQFNWKGIMLIGLEPPKK